MHVPLTRLRCEARARPSARAAPGRRPAHPPRARAPSTSTWPGASGRRTPWRWRPRAGTWSRSPRPTTAPTRSSSRTPSSSTATSAVITRPGADERKPETAGTETALAELGYRIVHIEAPGTLDGGDVLKHGGTVWVGVGGRTNAEGIGQLAAHLAPLGATVDGRAGLEGAAPQVVGHRAARRHRHRLRAAGRRPLGVAELPGGARGGRRPRRAARRRRPCSCPPARRAPEQLFEARGLRVVAVDITEFEKLEGCVTCLSVRLRG